MEKNKKFSFKDFETLIENENGILVGGFSLITSPSTYGDGTVTNDKCTISNNCSGGNCVTGCGTSTISGSGGVMY